MEKGQKGSQKKVMVVIDESEHSYNALIWVLDNLKELVTQSSFIIFATQPLPSHNCASTAPQLGSAGLYFSFGPNKDLISSVQKRTRSVSMGLCKKAKSICAGRGILVEAITEAGEPKEVICNAVYKYGIDLLVMPDYHSSPLKRFFAESLSDYCLRNAKCPVLLVRKPAEQKSNGDMCIESNIGARMVTS